MADSPRAKTITVVSAWALAFGCAIGWDAFVLPMTMFLPIAGWMGTIVGVAAGAVVTAIIAWNYHYMMNLSPGQGGVYAYASRAFGCDHGFLCSWFLCLSYAAIVWADATAVGMLGHYLIGDAYGSVFHYNVGGEEVCLSCILLPILAIAATAAVCFRRRLAGRVQTILAAGLALGVAACFAVVCYRHWSGALEFAPPLSPKGGNRFMQVAAVFVLTPWLFVGFEIISNVTDVFRFPVKKSFGVMVASIVSAVVVYVLLTLILASRPVEGPASPVEWAGGHSMMIRQAFDILCAIFGHAGSAIFAATLVCALFTNLIGCTIGVVSIVSAMAEDGAMPAWFARRNKDGAPVNVIIALSAVLVFIAPLGQAVIEIFVDIAIVGLAIAYAYTSAATFKLAKVERNRVSMVFGAVGVVLSVLVALGFIVPAFMSNADLVASESYFVMVVWCLIGLLMFLFVFRRDKLMRFGRSQVVWISMLSMIFVLAASWIYQATYNMTNKAYGSVMSIYSDVSRAGDDDDEAPVPYDSRFSELFASERTRLTGEIMVNNIVLTALVGLAMFLMVALYNILRKRERTLEAEKAKAKSYFFSTVSHDIRTPLNAIIGFTEMLRMGMKNEEERNQALDAIAVSGKTLLGLVNDVLDLSKLEAGKMTIAPEPTDCTALFRSIMDGFRISAAKPDLEFRCRVKAMPLLMLDPLRIRQIVFNLVGNASKFTKRGHVLLHASYDKLPGAADGVFRFQVEDTGCGISEEDLARIGGAYVQVGAKQARNGGTGLGLAICRHLVHAMGGRITASSTLGKGSTFAIEIPGVKAVRSARHETALSLDADGESGRKAAKIRRILVADDQKMNCMVLKALLRTAGDFEVVTAHNGKEALEILEEQGAEKFDLVLTDLWMPELDGEGLVKAIRANPALSGLRVIAVTADVEFDEKAAGAGFDGVLYKPVTAAKLSKTVFGEGEK